MEIPNSHQLLYSKKYLLLVVFIVMLFLSNTNAQYLRDNTKILEADSFYPTEDNVAQYYKSYETYPLRFNNVLNIPEIEVEFENISFPFYFDFGNSNNITITTALKNEIKYSVIDTANTLNPDGSVRDKILKIIAPDFKVFGKRYSNEESELVEWKTYSTIPFNGLIGLKYLDKKSFTLNCEGKNLIISAESILKSVDEKQAEIIELKTFRYHPFGIHFEGKVNNERAIIYFDTGKSHTALNRKLFPENRILTDKSGSFYDGTVELLFKGIKVKIENPRVKNINRSIESDLITGVEVGIDLLKYFILSVDRAADNNVLIIHK